MQVAGEEKVEPLKKAVQSLPSSTVKLSPQKIAYNTIQTENKKIRNKKVQIHRLSIPRGETFKVVLSEGTEVFLNSDSRLAYPTVFKGKERVVSLEGEAYFKVAKDAAHPFIVKSGICRFVYWERNLMYVATLLLMSVLRSLQEKWL